MNCVNHPQTLATAYCRTCGKALCASCQRPVKGVIYCEECLASRVEGQPTVAPAMGAPGAPPMVHGNTPNPAVAAILSGFLPFGTGVMYCGEFARALVHAGVFFGLIAVESTVSMSGLGNAIFGVGIGLWYFFMIFDSIRVARAKQMGEPIPDIFGLGLAKPAEPVVPGAGGFAGDPQAAASGCWGGSHNGPLGAIILIGLGILFLLGNVFTFDWDRIWPLFLVVLGIYLLFRNHQRATHWGNDPYYGWRYRGYRAYTAPVILFTIAAMGFLDEYTRVSFDRSWPLILIVVGGLQLLRMSSGQQHDGAQFPPVPPAAPGAEPPSSEVSHG